MKRKFGVENIKICIAQTFVFLQQQQVILFWCCWPLNTVYKYKQTFEKAFKLSNKVQKGERQG